MRDVFLVTIYIENLSFPVGYFPLEEALRMKQEMLSMHRQTGRNTDVLITYFEKLPMDMPVEQERVLEVQGAY